RAGGGYRRPAGHGLRHARRRRAPRPRRGHAGAGHRGDRVQLGHRRRHRVRRDHRRPARPVAAARGAGGGAPVRRVQGGRLGHAGVRGRADRDRRRRAVPHRALHRGAAHRAGGVPHPGAGSPPCGPRRAEGGGGVTTTTLTTTPSSGSLEADLRHVRAVSRKPAIAYVVVVALLALLLALAPSEGDTSCRFSAERDAIRIPDVSVPGMTVAWICVALTAVIARAAVALLRVHRSAPLWMSAVFALVGFVAFLSWAGAGSDRDFPVTRLVGGAVLLAVPLVFGALGGVIGERAVVVNIAIESQLLAGAFFAAVVGSLTKNPFAGLFAAILAGMLVALLLGVFAISYRVDQ